MIVNILMLYNQISEQMLQEILISVMIKKTSASPAGLQGDFQCI